MSDLQFVLHHVEGVVGEVDLLDAVDDLLLRLGVDGLFPHLPQLLLKEGDTDGERKDGDKKRKRIKKCCCSVHVRELKYKGAKFF